MLSNESRKKIINIKFNQEFIIELYNLDSI